MHVVGSNDDHAPWFTDRADPNTGQPLPETGAEHAQRTREYTRRVGAAVDWIDEIFNAAELGRGRGVVIGMQADMPAILARLVVQGSTNEPREWLRLYIDPHRERVFSCDNVAFRTGTVTACPAPLAP